jgi:cellulose synthase/poly-beta-1,6-N-acetylglucosamine synthase-like glycosyltransferase
MGSSRLVVLIAAHNEETSIVATLRALRAQTRPADLVAVAADNCTDDTLARARSVRGVRAFKTMGNSRKKPGALNQAWRRYAADADLVVCLDADTILPPDALELWEREFDDNAVLGGCSAKFTMLVAPGMSRYERLLVRVQRAEFAKWTDVALRRGRRTSVLAGTACCMRNDALAQVAAWRSERDEGDGPWIETSLVEDFELTYRLRERGWETKVSGDVRAFTDAMTDLRSLWAQRMKWQSGTVTDLLHFGVNRLTAFDWWQQLQGLVAVAVRALWIALLVATIAAHRVVIHPIWFIPPLLFIANDVKAAFRIPYRDAADVAVAGLLLPQEGFAFLRGAWFAASWAQVLGHRIFGLRGRDRWAMQAHAERGRRSHARAIPRIGDACSEGALGGR